MADELNKKEQEVVVETEESGKITPSTIARTVCLAIALANIILTQTGYNPLNISDDVIYNVVSDIALIVTAVWSWWKNNSFTKSAITSDKVLKTLKESK